MLGAYGLLLCSCDPNWNGLKPPQMGWKLFTGRHGCFFVCRIDACCNQHRVEFARPCALGLDSHHNCSIVGVLHGCIRIFVHVTKRFARSVDNRTLIQSGEARLVGWSRQMLYSGFNILPRSVFWSADFNGRSDNLDVIRASRIVGVRVA